MTFLPTSAVGDTPRDAFRLLDAEWDLLNQHNRPARTVARWLRDAGVLEAGVVPLRLNGLLKLLQDRDHADKDREHSDRWLGALLARARGRGGEAALATRVVVKAMMPSAVRTAQRLAVYSGPLVDVAPVVISSLWQVVVTYPLERRPAKVAANLALETLHLATRELGRERPASWGQDPDWQFADAEMAPDRMAEKEWLSAAAAQLSLISESGWEQATGRRGELLDLLVWAVNADVVSAEDARHLLLLVEEQHQAGALRRPGVREAARARKRRSRAMQRLRAAAPDFLAESA